jgi:hypothetical protein
LVSLYFHFYILYVSFNKEIMATPSPNPNPGGQKIPPPPLIHRHGSRRFRYGGGGGGGQLMDDFQDQSTDTKMTQQQKTQIKDVIQHQIFAICNGFNDIVLNNNKQKIKTRSRGGPLQQFQISKDLKDSIQATLGGDKNPLSKKWYTILCYRSLSLEEGNDFQTKEPYAHEIVNLYKSTVENPIKENMTKKINVILLEGLKSRIRQGIIKRYHQNQQEPPSQQEINQQVTTQTQPFLGHERERAGYIAIQMMAHVHIELLTFFQQELGSCF